jgi:hypothetical protein
MRRQQGATTTNAGKNKVANGASITRSGIAVRPAPVAQDFFGALIARLPKIKNFDGGRGAGCWRHPLIR